MLTLLLYGLSHSSASGGGNSFRLQLYERVGISIRAVKRFKGLTRLTDVFHAYEKVEKTFWFCDLYIRIYL